MKTFAIRHSHSLKLSTKIFWLFVAISLSLFSLFAWFDKKATPKFIHIADLNITRYMEQIASDFKMYSLDKNTIDNFLKVQENSNGEIVTIDYDMALIYEVSNQLALSIQNAMDDYENLKTLPYESTYKQNGQNNYLILMMPFGVVSDSIFLTNLGPKIPVAVHLINSVFTQVKTRAKDYGINNALLEIYMEVTITYEIVTPVTAEEKQLQYEFLIDSKVIQGKVPNWYGNSFESQSAFLMFS